MEKAKRLAKKFKKAADKNDINKCIKLSKKIHSLMQTYEISC